MERKKIMPHPTDEQIREILESIADLYHSPEAIVFEYVQNSIDSALELKEKYGESILPRKIIVHLDSRKNRFVVQDDCEGISTERLNKLPEDVFSSKKKSYPWTSGQFGYGIQSFRAWFEKVTICTLHMKEQTGRTLTFKKNDIFGEFDKAPLHPFGALYDDESNERLQRNHGTDVFIEDLIKKENRKSYFNYISNSLTSKLPIHFEEFLRSGLVQIYVYTWFKDRSLPATRKIEAIDYHKIPGKEIAGKIEDNEGNLFANYYFKIIDANYLNKDPRIKDYRPRVNRLGSLVQDISKLTSFKEYCNEKNIDAAVWERPEIIGYIDIRKKIEIDINRVDFPPSKDLDFFYSKLEELTNEIKNIFDNLDKEKLKAHEQSLSEIISDVFTDIASNLDVAIHSRNRLMKTKLGQFGSNTSETGAGFLVGNKDYHLGGSAGEGPSLSINNHTPEAQIQSSTGNSKGELPTDNENGNLQYKKIRQRGVSIEIKPLGENLSPSDLWGDSVIVVNSSHPFYKERLGSNGKSVNVITKRLISYLAFVTTPWFLDLYYRKKGVELESKEKVNKIVEIIAKVEKELWNRKEEIRRKVAMVEEDEPSHSE